MLLSTDCMKSSCVEHHTDKQAAHTCSWLLSCVPCHQKAEQPTCIFTLCMGPATLNQKAGQLQTESNFSHHLRLIILLNLYMPWVWAQQEFLKAIWGWVGNARGMVCRENVGFSSQLTWLIRVILSMACWIFFFLSNFGILELGHSEDGKCDYLGKRETFKIKQCMKTVFIKCYFLCKAEMLFSV